MAARVHLRRWHGAHVHLYRPRGNGAILRVPLDLEPERHGPVAIESTDRICARLRTTGSPLTPSWSTLSSASPRRRRRRCHLCGWRRKRSTRERWKWSRVAARCSVSPLGCNEARVGRPLRSRGTRTTVVCRTTSATRWSWWCDAPARGMSLWCSAVEMKRRCLCRFVVTRGGGQNRELKSWVSTRRVKSSRVALESISRKWILLGELMDESIARLSQSRLVANEHRARKWTRYYTALGELL